MSGLGQLIAQRWPEIITFVLVTGRVGGLMISAPFWGSRVVPLLVRAWVAILLALAIYPVAQPTSLPDNVAVFPLLTVLAGEILFGLILGWTAQLLFSGMRLAGQEIELKLGLGLISLADPHQGGQQGVFAAFLELLAGLIFFAMNGHHHLINALTASYSVFPLLGDKFTLRLLEGLVTSAGQIFAIALRVSAPVIIGLLLSDIVLGVLSRAIPQMNVFLVGQPVQFGFGIFLLMLSVPALVWFCARHLPELMMLPTGLR
jgi:flagellar biosynthetic protein FliR